MNAVAVRAVGRTGEGQESASGFVLPAWDHRQWPGLSEAGRDALAALDPTALRRNRARGIPRRNARHWTVLAQLVEPLDATLAGLHHGEDIRYRRAGAHAAATIPGHCASTGRFSWPHLGLLHVTGTAVGRRRLDLT